MDGLRPGEAARICGMTPHTLIRWERMGLLKAVRTVGGLMRWRGVRIEALLRDNSNIDSITKGRNSAWPTRQSTG